MRFNTPSQIAPLVLACLVGSFSLPASAQQVDNVILITLDGMRWQEVFRGIDQTLANDEESSPRGKEILERFWRENRSDRARALFPFLHEVVFAQGRYAGDRDAGSCARVSNDWYFSYPGYSEILTGIVNPTINTNGKVWNPERTFLELLNSKQAFHGKLSAFASWDVFPYIFNVERSGLTVNALGSVPPAQNAFEQTLQTLSNDIPPPWETVRHDAFTHHYALSAMRETAPRVLYISYGETDDFAHDGRYDEYILAAHRTDRFIQEIWELSQSLEAYRNNTMLFVTVDHGRGEEPIETWQHHASKTSVSGYMSTLAQYEEGIVGSDAVWMGAIGPGLSASGLVNTSDNCLTSNRIAATLLQWLGENYKEYNVGMGEPLQEFLP